MMKLVIIAVFAIFSGLGTLAQQLDSIYFNLYTDSLKKGTYNYINVEGKYSNGRYLPLGPKDLIFSASAGTFDKNSLFIDTAFKEEKVTVRVEAISNRRLKDEIVIYIKKHESTERLPTMSEVLNKTEPVKRKSSRKK